MSDNMHPYYLSDYINKLVSNLRSDMDFLAQGLQSTYASTSKRNAIDLQWHMAAVKNVALDFEDKLKQLEREIEKLNDKKV